MKKCVMIFNSKSGKIKSKELIRDISKIIEKRDYKLKIIYTKRKRHAVKIVKKLNDDIDLVISAGGDGTFHEVIEGNLKRKNKLLIANLPLGTTNDVGVMYGLDGTFMENLVNLLDGNIKNIDICLANNNPFTYFLGFGNYVDVSFNTPKKLKEKYGYLGYIIHGLKSLKGKLKLYDLEYEINGKKYNGTYSFIFITNGNHIAGIDNIYDDVKLDDNMFEIAFFNIKSKISLIKNLCLFRFKNIEEMNDCDYFKTNNLKLYFENANNGSWCCDGEELKLMNKNIEISVTKEINVLIPKKNIDKLFTNKE